MAYSASNPLQQRPNFANIDISAQQLADDLANLEAAVNVIHQRLLGGGLPSGVVPVVGPTPVPNDGAVGRVHRQISEALDRVLYIRSKVSDIAELFPS
jgi:hypothetical protein